MNSHIFNVFAWCRVWSKTANPLCPGRKMQKSANASEQMSENALFSEFLPRPCPKVRTLRSFFARPHPKVWTLLRILTKSANRFEVLASMCPKMRTLSRVSRRMCPKVWTFRKFWRACAQKCEPFRCFVWMCWATPKFRTLSQEFAPKVLHHTIDQKSAFL